MSREYLEDAMQEISDEYLEEAVEWKPAEARVIAKKQKTQQKGTLGMACGRKQVRGWRVAVALVTAVAVIATAVFGIGGFRFGRRSSVLKAFAISEAEYPKASPYPDPAKFGFLDSKENQEAFSEAFAPWRAEQKNRWAQAKVIGDGLDGFWQQSISAFLKDAGEENRVYSPVNVYMALAMLAEITDGDSRRQVTELLGVKSVEELREQAKAVWTANYMNDGVNTSILGSSLWLRNDMEFKKPVLETLANTYYASSYRGEMGSEKMNQAFQTWLNEQTGGLLEDYVEEETLSEETILALASTIYYQAKWTDEFFDEKNEDGVFHSPVGDVQCEFMYEHMIMGGTYYWGEKFGAVEKSLDNSHRMWFILPDEGVSVDELLPEAEMMDFFIADEWEKQKAMNIHFYLPKFDVSSKMDLKEGLNMLGVTDVFDAALADFSPVTDLEGLCLSKANHAARVTVDEEGVTAVAYTVMEECGGVPSQEDEIEFRLDRPFLFAIMGTGDVPLFVGVVNRP